MSDVLRSISCPDAWCACAEAPELGALCALAAVGAPLRALFLAVKFQIEHFSFEWEMESQKGEEMVTQQFRELAERAWIEMRAAYGCAKRLDIGGPSSQAVQAIELIGSEFKAKVLAPLLDEGASHLDRQSAAANGASALAGRCETLEQQAFSWYGRLRHDMESRVGVLRDACPSRRAI